MEVIGKALSARRVSTLKLPASRMASAMYSMAFCAIASGVLSHAAARTTAAMPNTFVMACCVSSISMSSDFGST